MDYSHNDINKKALYVLKVNNAGLFTTDYYPIDYTAYEQWKEKAENVYDETQIACDKITVTDEAERDAIRCKMIQSFLDDFRASYPDIISKGSMYNYADDISGKYQSMPCPDAEWINSAHPFRYRLERLIHAYFLDKAMGDCIANDAIKAHSHRTIGWYTDTFVLDDTFSVTIKTNFGFGSANYFCVTLIFDGIQIIPYSRLVLYRFADFWELIKHTWEFGIVHEDWGLAFDKVRDACNHYHRERHDSFVKRYFVDELDKLTTLLSRYVKVDGDVDSDDIYKPIEVKLSENEYGNYISRERGMRREKIGGFPLIVFRTEKTSGAAGFMESIQKVNKLFPVQKYIDIIKNCCREVLPQLNKAVGDLATVIDKLEKRYKIECKERDKLKKEYEKCYSKWEEIRDQYTKIESEKREKIFNDNDGKYSKYSEQIDKLLLKDMRKEFPKLLSKWTKIHKEELPDKKEKYENQNAKCDYTFDECNKHKTYLSTISECQEKIENYLSNQ
jgi:hypothetical protein